MEFLAVIGAVNVMLATVAVIALPVCLAIYVSPMWLWLYGAYAILTAAFVFIIISVNAGKKIEDKKNSDNCNT